MFTYGTAREVLRTGDTNADVVEEKVNEDDIEENILKWANKNSKDTEGLEELDKQTRAQVELIKPALKESAVVAQLQQSGLLSSSDVTGGADSMAKVILRTLLLKRTKSGDALPFKHWSHDDFKEYTAKEIEPLIPFLCRSLPAEKAVQRVLILLHGNLVCGDDLASEADVLHRFMPETVIVMPEAPIVVDAEHQLRTWWLPKEPVPEGADFDELKKLGALDAPEATKQRVVATVKQVLREFGDVPVVLCGFSQGSQLLAQSLKVLHKENIDVKGLMILSGLVAPFQLPTGIKCLAFHGAKDTRIPLNIAQKALSSKEMKGVDLEVFKEVAHEISDDELEKVAAFCDKVAPVAKDSLSEKDKASEAQKAKMIRYVKRMSTGLSVYDKDWYMTHICRIDMTGLGPESPSLGNGLVRYHLHDAGPSSRGLVVFFHGMVQNLRAETDQLAQAYVKALNVSVCVLDYRQQTSCLGIDAQLCLDSLDEISGSTTKPVIIHGVGLGSTGAIHMALASGIDPTGVGRRIRLLVLDAAMGAIHMNVGCTTKDPIGNDSKLAYVRLPLCILGGDDPLCGLTVGDTQWLQITEVSEEMKRTDKIPDLTMLSDTALRTEAGTGSKRLNPGLFDSVNKWLDAKPGDFSTLDGRGKDFLEDVLNVSEEFSLENRQTDFPKWNAPHGTNAKARLMQISSKVKEVAKESLTSAALSEAKEAPPAEREAKVVKAMLMAFGPTLAKDGTFEPGIVGIQQFDDAMCSTSEFFDEVKHMHQELTDAFSLDVLSTMDKDKLHSIAGAVAKEEGDTGKAEAGPKVTVTHLTKGGSLDFSIPETATILELRKAVMAKLSETNMNKVKIVTQEAKGTKMIPDSEVIGKRTEFLMVGRAFT